MKLITNIHVILGIKVTLTASAGRYGKNLTSGYM